MPYDEANFRDDIDAQIEKARAEGIHPLVIAKVCIEASDSCIEATEASLEDPMHEPLGFNTNDA